KMCSDDLVSLVAIGGGNRLGRDKIEGEEDEYEEGNGGGVLLVCTGDLVLTVARGGNKEHVDEIEEDYNNEGGGGG
ncbi:hypothetical protein ACJMK2_038270, partial [Sinanodonta woodiana]